MSRSGCPITAGARPSVWFHPIAWPIGVFCAAFVLRCVFWAILIMAHLVCMTGCRGPLLVAIPLALSRIYMFWIGCPTSAGCPSSVWFLFLVCEDVSRLFFLVTASGLRSGPLAGLLWLVVKLTALHVNYNSAGCRDLNDCNDLSGSHEGDWTEPPPGPSVSLVLGSSTEDVAHTN